MPTWPLVWPRVQCCGAACAGRTTRIRTTQTGRYRAILTPGYYTMRVAERIGITSNIQPQRVHIRSGHVDRLDFSIDTGIR